jgi:GNAT superfamily N-acetyltransferase
MSRCRSDLLLVRPARPAEAGTRWRVGLEEVYVLVDVGAPAPAEPLARCVVVRGDRECAVVRDIVVRPGHRACGHEHRLLADVADLLRAVGLRELGVLAGRSSTTVEL